MQDKELSISSVSDLKVTLATHYQKQIENYFGDQKKALKFLSAVVSSVQRNPKLLECEPASVINSFMAIAQLEFMPSGVSGEAYVLPYNNKKKVGNNWVNVMEAQFQLGYQGLVTLFYRAGAKSIIAEIVRKNDKFQMVNGEIHHEVDVFSDDRGDAIGAYVIVELQMGGKVYKAMSKKEILAIGSKFSKSYSTSFSPWNAAQDPELWMWKKTVLKQCAKLVPKNETIFKAIAEDNKDSNIEERKERFADLPKPPRIAAKEAAKKAESEDTGTKVYGGEINLKTSDLPTPDDTTTEVVVDEIVDESGKGFSEQEEGAPTYEPVDESAPIDDGIPTIIDGKAVYEKTANKVANKFKKQQ